MKAIAVFDGAKIKGTVTFSETANNTVLHRPKRKMRHKLILNSGGWKFYLP